MPSKMYAVFVMYVSLKERMHLIMTLCLCDSDRKHGLLGVSTRDCSPFREHTALWEYVSSRSQTPNTQMMWS